MPGWGAVLFLEGWLGNELRGQRRAALVILSWGLEEHSPQGVL